MKKFEVPKKQIEDRKAVLERKRKRQAKEHEWQNRARKYTNDGDKLETEAQPESEVTSLIGFNCLNLKTKGDEIGPKLGKMGPKGIKCSVKGIQKTGSLMIIGGDYWKLPTDGAGPSIKDDNELIDGQNSSQPDKPTNGFRRLNLDQC